MNKDNIQELLKPRVKCTTRFLGMKTQGWAVGDIFKVNEDTEDAIFILSLPNQFPSNFKFLEWWEDRDVNDMPEYLQRNTKDKIIFKAVKHNVDATHGLGFVTSEGKIKSYCNYLPATETEYLNQTNQP